ncbi:MAG: cell shape determination protein CcmA [Gammaproteobacteria bacterium]|jgi:cytoskeletal protein CcmA (bactofilin family)|nr:cell shape determination protein CcmA [Gammaproteobacteria bacterium]
MFGSKKIKSSTIDTLVGQGVEITGDIKFQGGLHLDGTIKGNVSTADNAEGAVLVISDQGRVEGDVYVAFAVINGEVIGNVYASEKLELSAKARISGNVEYNLLEMTSGAEINGQMLHKVKARKLPENPIEKSQDNIHRLDDTTTVATKN